MRIETARNLAIALLVGLGAAHGPSASSGSEPKARSSAPPEVIRIGETLYPVDQPYQVGTASWYGEYFEGKPTASGEPFNMYDLTAAHPSLPLGTLVRVTNLRNRRSVVVRINDRGPVVPGRIIDLSYYAAWVLRFDQLGLQRVRLDVVPEKKKSAFTVVTLRQPAW